MKEYVIMPERCRFYMVEAVNAEMAYRGVCCWYSEKRPIVVMDSETGETVIYARQLDQGGNLAQIARGLPDLSTGENMGD